MRNPNRQAFEDRKAQQLAAHQQFQHARAVLSMRDRVKVEIVTYLMQNPDWTPEGLKQHINFLIKQYGTGNRYSPRNVTPPVEGTEDGNTDTARVEGSAGS